LHIFSAGARIRALAGSAAATIDIASAIRKTRMMFSFQATQFPPALKIGVHKGLIGEVPQPHSCIGGLAAVTTTAASLGFW
jgi:hypothetical protein